MLTAVCFFVGGIGFYFTGYIRGSNDERASWIRRRTPGT